MHASVRKYKGSEVERITGEAEKEFVPIVKQVDGFGGYYMVDAGDGTLITITVAESEAAVEESVQKAADWIKGREDISPLIEGPPEVTNGEVVVSASA